MVVRFAVGLVCTVTIGAPLRAGPPATAPPVAAPSPADARNSDVEQAAAAAKARAARGPAHIVVDTSAPGWRKDARVRVTVDGAPTPVHTAKPFAIIEVDDGKERSRRVASLLPGVQYVVRGNPCAQWTLHATGDFASGPTLRVDASRLPEKWFPIAITLGDRDAQALALDAPGSTDQQSISESAMCIGAGVRVRVESRSSTSGSKAPLFDAVVIAHEGDATTLRIDGPDRWTLAVEGVSALP